MSDAQAAKRCNVCGKPVADDPLGVMIVQPDGSKTGKVTYFCGEHNPNPPSPEQLADRERGEIQGAASFLLEQDHMIRQLIDLDRPVSAGDRASIGTLLLGMHHRVHALTNELRQMQGKEPIPMRPTGIRRSPTQREPGEAESTPPLLRPQYRIRIRHLWEPSIDEQVHTGMDVRYVDVITAIHGAGATFLSGSPGELESSFTFHAPSDEVLARVHQAVEVPGRHQATMLQYLPEFPRGAPLTIWRREETGATNV
jgi:hypothetical protein